jgi:ADP-ribose pyrophosphatase
MNIEVIESRTVYQGPVFSIRQDTLLLPDGSSAQIDVIDHRSSVTILPVDEQGQVWFIRQYRQAIAGYLLELPAGVAESGEPPQVSAQRELREETGMAARQLIELGSFYLAPGYSSEFMHVYLARDLYPDPLPADKDEILEVEKKPVAAAYTLAEQGELKDSKSLITLFWAKPILQEMGFLD